MVKSIDNNINPFQTGSFSIINNQDGNDVVKLDSETLIDALYEALETLGWGLVIKGNKSEE